MEDRIFNRPSKAPHIVAALMHGAICVRWSIDLFSHLCYFTLRFLPDLLLKGVAAPGEVVGSKLVGRLGQRTGIKQEGV